jgi:hypothetical protein
MNLFVCMNPSCNDLDPPFTTLQAYRYTSDDQECPCPKCGRQGLALTPIHYVEDTHLRNGISLCGTPLNNETVYTNVSNCVLCPDCLALLPPQQPVRPAPLLPSTKSPPPTSGIDDIDGINESSSSTESDLNPDSSPNLD